VLREKAKIETRKSKIGRQKTERRKSNPDPEGSGVGTKIGMTGMPAGVPRLVRRGGLAPFDSAQGKQDPPRRVGTPLESARDRQKARILVAPVRLEDSLPSTPLRASRIRILVGC